MHVRVLFIKVLHFRAMNILYEELKIIAILLKKLSHQINQGLLVVQNSFNSFFYITFLVF